MRFFIFIALIICSYNSGSAEIKMIKILGGEYTPFFETSKDGIKKKTQVEEFYLDIIPVTNNDFLTFVKRNTLWKKSEIKKIFAEETYLKHWDSDLSFADNLKNKPVKFVSWFAAKSYCESIGKTLPTVLQWEYVGSADESKPFAIGTKEYKERILHWYGKPSIGEINNVGEGPSNYWGIKDMHGLHWEWTLDFNSSLVTGESREDSILNKNKFCGSGSLNAKDKLDYGAFMRFGFRSSLKGNYAIGNLGFRCAKAIGE
jgi:formylglycine-generating enzyme required for sulfatase activity